MASSYQQDMDGDTDLPSSSSAFGASSLSYNEYSVAYPIQSPRGSLSSFASSSAYSGSDFSRRASVFSASSASTAPSSQPSQFTVLTTFAQSQINRHQQPGTSVMDLAEGLLWNEVPRFHVHCDLRPLTGCPRVFPANDVRQYVEHMGSDHLGWKFPMRTSCWWCDGFDFQCQEPVEAALMFERRMEHISAHVLEDPDSVRPPRADFHLLDHLRGLNVISMETFEREIGVKEIHCPDGIFPAGYRRPVNERDLMAIYDLEREEKEQRRSKTRRDRHRQR